MSSYLNIYVQPKKTDKKFLLCSFSRSSDIYQAFYENISVACAHNGKEETQYTELSTSIIDSVIQDLEMDKAKWVNRVNEYEKHANGNTEIIEEVIIYKDNVNDIQSNIDSIKMIRTIVQDSEIDCNAFDKVFMNID